uniref:Peptidase M48 domain-containing protein n=1 Tax=Triticum urartu TaxID=4572 RepID=A0A8R7TMW8_TRIUA
MIQIFRLWFPTNLLVAPLLRRNELEADYIGMMLLAAAGFDPHAAPLFFGKVGRMEGESALTDLLSFFPFKTHPSWRRRARLLSQPKVMEEAMELYTEATGGLHLEEVYGAALLPGLRQQLPVGAHGHVAVHVERVPVGPPDGHLGPDPRPDPHRELHRATSRLRGRPGHVGRGGARRHGDALEGEGRRGLGRLVHGRPAGQVVVPDDGAVLAVEHGHVEPVVEEGHVPVRVADGELPRKDHAGVGATGRLDAGGGEGDDVEARPVRAHGEVGDEEEHAGDEEQGEEGRADDLGAAGQVRPLSRERAVEPAGGPGGRRRLHGGARACPLVRSLVTLRVHWRACTGLITSLFRVLYWPVVIL